MNALKVVSGKLSERAIKKWETLLSESSLGEWDFCSEEGIWRRTQSNENKEESDWRDINDGRRRMLHYKHVYDLIEINQEKFLVIKESYIWVHYLLPEEELRELRDNIKNFLRQGGWVENKSEGVFSCGDLMFELKEGISHKEDVLEKRYVPQGYGFIECKIYTKDFNSGESFQRKPWNILNTGIRKKDIRGNPKEVKSFSEVKAYLPAQIEIGCGPSIEAGVAPLNFLHKLYSVTDSSGKFVFSYPEDTFIKRILCNPDVAYKELGEMFYSVLEAKSTPFYETLVKLYKKGYFVGPVITNNFDCIIPSVGLPQLYIRRFEERYFHPNISFHEEAKSLWVIGSHADRRGIQRLARKKGLKVLYIDPEGYSDQDGGFEKYELESPQDEDILFVAKASHAFEKLEREM